MFLSAGSFHCCSRLNSHVITYIGYVSPRASNPAPPFADRPQICSILDKTPSVGCFSNFSATCHNCPSSCATSRSCNLLNLLQIPCHSFYIPHPGRGHSSIPSSSSRASGPPASSWNLSGTAKLLRRNYSTRHFHDP